MTGLGRRPADATPGSNIHATALAVGGVGLLILGESGSGKSSLALELLRRARSERRFARLVADDRSLVRVASGRVLATSPHPIAGLVEMRGYGPAAIVNEPAAIIDRAVRIVPGSFAPRHREDRTSYAVGGVDLPCLVVSQGDRVGSADAVLAWLAAGPADN